MTYGLLAGWTRYPQANDANPGELGSRKLKKPTQPRWIRERKRFEKEHMNLLDAHVKFIADNVLEMRLDFRWKLDMLMEDVKDIRRTKGEANDF